MRLRLAAVVCILLLCVMAVPALFSQSHTFIGADKCKLCHKIQYASWLKTKHATALASLTPADQAKPECVQCHITGASKDLPGVQCEGCHGPGSDYKTLSIMKNKPKAIAAGLIMPDEALCKKCHNSKSPHFKGFNFAESSKKVHDMKKPG